MVKVKCKHCNSRNLYLVNNLIYFKSLDIHIFSHCLENRTRSISTPYNSRHWWDLSHCISACKSPTVPLGWSKKHQIFRINFFFWIIVGNVLKLACVKYVYLIPSGNVPTLWSKFSYFHPNLPKQTHLGYKSVRLLLIPKNCNKSFLCICQQPKAYLITYQ